MKLIIIDNYDSFTYNLVQLFAQQGSQTRVYRNDRITMRKLRLEPFDSLLISPGPMDPAHAGISLEALQAYSRNTPILGVCLGMQCLNENFGGSTQRAPAPLHGKTSQVRHANRGILRGLSNPFSAARYHSLLTRPGINSPLRIDAVSEDGVIMALTHPSLPLFGIQFHPESFLTPEGACIARSFLQMVQNHREARNA